MSELKELYNAIDTLKRLGVAIDEKLINDIVRVEETIINSEVIPALKEAMEPVISQIQREILILVEYKPNEPLEVKITKKRSISIPADQDPVVNFAPRIVPARTVERQNIAPRTGLKITFPGGQEIFHRYAWETMAAAIKYIGTDRVKSLNITCSGVPLVWNQKHPTYGNAQKEIAPQTYVMTHSSTAEKKRILDRISDRLGLGLIVEIKE